MVAIRDRLRDWNPYPVARFLLVVLIEIALVALGLLQGAGSFDISPIWPAAGFAIAITYVYGYHMGAAIAIGETLASLLHGGTLAIALPAGILAGLLGILGAWLMRRWCPHFVRLEARTGETIRFLATAVLLVPPLSALGGTALLVVFGGLDSAEFATTLQTWWLGDTVGIVVCAPFVLAWLEPDQRRSVRRRPLEAAAIGIGAIVATGLAFSADTLRPLPEPAVLVLPFLVWSALRFGLIGVASVTFLTAIIVTATAAAGLGPYAAGGLEATLRLQFLIGIIAATMLVLAATASRRDHLQHTARRQARFVHSVAENLPGAVFRQRINAAGELEFPYIAGRFARSLGLRTQPPRASGQDPAPSAPAHAAFEAEDRAHLVAALQRSARTLDPVELDLRLHDADGSPRWGRLISRPTHDERGHPMWDGILLDITEEKAQRERVEFLARHDPLTGLLNRHGLQAQLDPLLARARRQQLSIAFCLLDLDGFKEINDSYGRAAGDALLQTLGQRLQRQLREEDLKARLGGDEFLIVQVDIGDRSVVEQRGQRLLENLGRLVEHDGRRLQPTLSMGIALFPEDGANDDAVLAAADEALHIAKGRERGNLVLHNPALAHVRARGRLELSRDLAQAIEHDGLSVHYQPQIDAESGRVVGVEALARWYHPERGSIVPGEFIPLAERHGLAPALDLAILRKALSELGASLDPGRTRSRLAVNLSGASIRDAHHRRRVIATLRELNVPGDRIELELTETTLAQGMDESAARALEEIRATGVSFAIDDFGTGYGSLTYLRNLPIGRIKIDRSFVQQAPRRQRDREIVRALVSLANNLGLTVVAEGIETRAQLEAIQVQGCIAYQGFYFARPMALADLQRYLDQHGWVPA